jgi:hypothetical protein
MTLTLSRRAAVVYLMPALIFLYYSTISFAQPGPAGPSGNPFPAGDNQWHLGYSTVSYSATSTYAEVAKTSMGDQDANHPMEVNSLYTDNTNKITLANPPTGCQNGGPSQTNACTFVTATATAGDDHNIRYDFRNWGGRCVIWLRLNVFAPISVWQWADFTPWSSGQTFIVVVPEGGSNPEVFGKLNGVNIFMTPSSPLSDADSQHFTLADQPKTVPGLGTIYRITAK